MRGSIRRYNKPTYEFIDYQFFIGDCIMYPTIIDKQIVLSCEDRLLFFFYTKILESWTKENFGSYTRSAVILKQKHLIVQFKVPNQARTILYKIRINLTY